MFKKFAIIFALVCFTLPALAATILPTNPQQGDKRYIKWEQINNDDTAAPANWPGGKGYIEVNGTIGNSELEMTFGIDIATGLIAIDSDNAPDGLYFSSATGTGATVFELPRGLIGISFSSAGQAAQDIDINIAPIDE